MHSPHRYLSSITSTINGLTAAVDALNAARAAMPHDDLAAEARHCNGPIIDAMTAIRKHADALEDVCDRSVWGMPTYHEMLFHQS